MNIIPPTAMPIFQDKKLSLHAKVVWSAWHVGLHITEEAWEGYLSRMRAPYVPLDDCREELRRNGWLA